MICVGHYLCVTGVLCACTVAKGIQHNFHSRDTSLEFALSLAWDTFACLLIDHAQAKESCEEPAGDMGRKRDGCDIHRSSYLVQARPSSCNGPTQSRSSERFSFLS